MSTEAGLGEYLKNVKRPQGQSEARARVEEIFEELGLPWSRAPQGDWKIASDVGEVAAGLDDAEEVLTVFQLLGPLNGKRKQNADFFYALLAANFSMTGACYAIYTPENSPAMLSIVGRIAAEHIDPEEVALTLKSLFEMSHVFDNN